MELFTPDFGLIFWMFIAFAILLFILWKWGWPVIIKSVEQRADLIDKGVEYAQSAKEQLDHAKEAADKQLAEARRQQADMLREAEKMKTQIIDEARTAAQTEAQKVMDAAKVSMEAERKEAERKLRNDVGQYALDIATKVVRTQLSDQKAQKQLVDSLLKEVDTDAPAQAAADAPAQTASDAPVQTAPSAPKAPETPKGGAADAKEAQTGAAATPKGSAPSNPKKK